MGDDDFDTKMADPIMLSKEDKGVKMAMSVPSEPPIMGC